MLKHYQCFHDYIGSIRAESENYVVGKSVILPSSFKGSPRNMAQHYLDVMCLISKYGKPVFFLTSTRNPKWSEIVNNLKHFEAFNDRPDLVSRVFYEKLQDLICRSTD